MGLAIFSLGILSAVVAAAQGGTRPDPQMKAVLDELAGLGPKPIESLSPTEARKQPTPADAVQALLRKRGISTSPEKVGKVGMGAAVDKAGQAQQFAADALKQSFDKKVASQ